MERLHNYRSLVAKVDDLCRRIAAEQRAHLTCREGCADCCRHVSLFPVEAFAMAVALSALPAVRVAHIRERARKATAATCPLLEDGRCLLYDARPIICRTHGFPLLAGAGEGRQIDFCPENFRGVTSLPASAVVSLDLLNTTLAAINAVFVASNFDNGRPGQERISIAAALQLKVG